MMKVYRLTVEILNQSRTMGEPVAKQSDYYLSTRDLAWDKLRVIHESKLGFSRETQTKTVFSIEELDVDLQTKGIT